MILTSSKTGPKWDFKKIRKGREDKYKKSFILKKRNGIVTEIKGLFNLGMCVYVDGMIQ